MNQDKTPLTYQKAGVDPDKAGRILSGFAQFQKGRPKDPHVLSGIGPFASCYALKDALRPFADPVLVTCCDGVGTKAKLALEWNALEGLGQDLVAMNVNDLLCAGAVPALFLDYYACGQLDENQLTTLLKSIQHGCELAECSLVGGETAEMPGLYHGADFDLAGFAVGFADRSQLLGAHRVQARDKLFAIESSGLHSNGFSLVRKLIERDAITATQKLPFSPETAADLFLAPTTIYVRALKPVLAQPGLHALAHLTGGGLFENLPRILPTGHRALVSSKAWPLPPLFTWIQERAGLNTVQLLSTFNAGVGMIAVAEAALSKELIGSLHEQGLRCWEIGQVEAAPAGAAPEVVWD